MKIHTNAECEPGKSLRAEELPENDACAICKDARTIPQHVGFAVTGASEAIRQGGGEIELRNLVRVAAEFGWALGATYTLHESAKAVPRSVLPLCRAHLTLLRSFVAAEVLKDRQAATARPKKKSEAH